MTQVPIVPDRLGWHSAIGNFLLNFGRIEAAKQRGMRLARAGFLVFIDPGLDFLNGKNTETTLIFRDN